MRLLRWLLAFVLGGFALLVAAALGLFVVFPEYARMVDDPIHAESVFSGYVPYTDVLATRRWHRRGAEGWDCSFAIVSLPDSAPQEPPLLPENRHGQPWYLFFGGDWLATPQAPLGDTTRDALGFCAQYFSADVNQRLAAAMTDRGSYYIIGSVGETVHIYSAPQRIAAQIRYGD